MPAVPAVTESNVSVVTSIHQTPQVAGGTIAAGAACAFGADGRVVQLGTGAAGISVEKAVAGRAVTLLKQGILDGYNLAGYAYGTVIYAEAGTGVLTDVATANIRIGRVVAGHSEPLGSTPAKLLEVDVT